MNVSVESLQSFGTKGTNSHRTTAIFSIAAALIGVASGQYSRVIQQHDEQEKAVLETNTRLAKIEEGMANIKDSLHDTYRNSEANRDREEERRDMDEIRGRVARIERTLTTMATTPVAPPARAQPSLKDWQRGTK